MTRVVKTNLILSQTSTGSNLGWFYPDNRFSESSSYTVMGSLTAADTIQFQSGVCVADSAGVYHSAITTLATYSSAAFSGSFTGPYQKVRAVKVGTTARAEVFFIG